MGHLSYQAMLRALPAGTWTGFRHSIKNIHLEQLPRCPVCLRMKNKHKPVSNVGRMVQSRPGLLFHMDLIKDSSNQIYQSPALCCRHY